MSIQYELRIYLGFSPENSLVHPYTHLVFKSKAFRLRPVFGPLGLHWNDHTGGRLAFNSLLCFGYCLPLRVYIGNGV